MVGAVLTLTSPTGDRCLSKIRGVDVFTVGDDWSEDTITFDNAPAPVAYNTSADVFRPGQVIFDVTADFTETDVATYYLEMPSDCGRPPVSDPSDLAGGGGSRVARAKRVGRRSRSSIAAPITPATTAEYLSSMQHLAVALGPEGRRGQSDQEKGMRVTGNGPIVALRCSLPGPVPPSAP